MITKTEAREILKAMDEKRVIYARYDYVRDGVP